MVVCAAYTHTNTHRHTQTHRHACTVSLTHTQQRLEGDAEEKEGCGGRDRTRQSLKRSLSRSQSGRRKKGGMEEKCGGEQRDTAQAYGRERDRRREREGERETQRSPHRPLSSLFSYRSPSHTHTGTHKHTLTHRTHTHTPKSPQACLNALQRLFCPLPLFAPAMRRDAADGEVATTA